jgi:hypothetical protein
MEIWCGANMTTKEQLRLLQKRAVRIICRAPFLAHTEPIAKDLNILLLNDLILFVQCVFMFKVYHAVYPNIITSLFSKVSVVSHYFTRQNVFNFFVKQCNYMSTRHFILHSGVFIWNNLPTCIKNTVNLRRFKFAVRSHFNVLHNAEFVL